MEASLLFSLGAVAAGFLALFMVAKLGCETLKRKNHVLAAQGRKLSPGNLLGLALENTQSLWNPMAAWLLKIPVVASLAEELSVMAQTKGWKATSLAVATSFLKVALGLFGIFTLLAGNLMAGLAAVACLCAAVVVGTQGAKDRSKEALRQEVPNALELMSACFSSGFTLLQTFQQVAMEIPGPLGKLFGRSASVLETGGTVAQSLDCLRKSDATTELGFVVAALEIQHESGGALNQVLATASKSVKSELALRRSLQVQTAQAKLSARIVTLLPFILVAIFSLVSPDFLKPFFSSLAGYGLLALALLMQALGIFLVQKALAVEGVS